MFKEEILKGKNAVYVNSEEEAKNFIEWVEANSDTVFNRIGTKFIKSYIGRAIEINHYWGNCFEYDIVERAERNGYNIIEYKDALKEPETIQAPNSDIKFIKPEFECELLNTIVRDNTEYYIGYVLNSENYPEPIIWDEYGRWFETFSDNNKSDKYNLTTYKEKKEWYEDESNFPCALMQLNCVDDTEIPMGIFVCYSIESYSVIPFDFRPATNEEIDSLKKDIK